MYQPRRHLL